MRKPLKKKKELYEVTYDTLNPQTEFPMATSMREAQKIVRLKCEKFNVKALNFRVKLYKIT